MVPSAYSVGDPQERPLRPVEFEILLTLVDGAGERHGYGILQETERRSGAALETGTMYRAIARLVKSGYVKPLDRRRPPGSDERRRYYAITALGRRVAAGEAARMERLVSAARRAHLLPWPSRA
jgi:DNA-binding PadR family transcriptional regulator